MDEKTKHAYWFNHETGETSWEKPAAAGVAASVAKASPIMIAKWQEPLNQPKPKPKLVTDENGFAFHVSCDIEGHDFACSGKRTRWLSLALLSAWVTLPGSQGRIMANRAITSYLELPMGF